MRQKWKPLILLSVIVPVSLLISLRLMGILPELEEPITIAESINLETVKWEFERPSVWIDMRENVGTTYDDGEVSVSWGVFIWGHDPTHPDYGSEVVSMAPNGSVVIKNGFIKNVYIVIREDYLLSFVDWFDLENWWEGTWWELHGLLKNLTIGEHVDKINEGNMKASIDLTCVNHTSSAYFWVPTRWLLRSPNNLTHTLEINTELTYFNGTVYKKIAQPFQLRIGPDDNDSFETADEIGLEGRKAVINLDHDPADYYKIWLEQGQVVHPKVLLPLHERVEDPEHPEWYYNLELHIYLYDPSRELVAHSVHGENATRQITITITSTGWWYIKIEAIWGIEKAYELNLIGLSEVESG